MKKLVVLMVSFAIAVSSFAYAPFEIDKKLQQSFDSSFPHATDVSWVELPDAYVVNFIEGGVRARAEYTRDQSTMKLTRYYYENNLPYYVRYIVKKQYPGKSIFGITEVSSVSFAGNILDVNYFIVLQDAKKWYTVKMDNSGNTYVVQKSRKG